MKKTIIALLAIGSMAIADDVTLRYSLTNFNSGSPANTATSASAGTTTVSHSAYVNWANYEDISGTVKAVANLTGNGRFYIQDTNGINAGGENVLNTTDGFTLVFNGKASANWADFLSVNVGEMQYKFETGGGDNLFKVYTPDGSVVKEVASVTSTGEGYSVWRNYALTVLGNSYTLSIWDNQGTKVGTTTFTGATGNLTDICEGSRFAEHWNYGAQLDNVGLYDGVLTDDNLKALVLSEAAGKGMIQSFSAIAVPEPTTATLSLLALAGLAARRRRK